MHLFLKKKEQYFRYILFYEYYYKFIVTMRFSLASP